MNLLADFINSLNKLCGDQGEHTNPLLCFIGVSIVFIAMLGNLQAPLFNWLSYKTKTQIARAKVCRNARVLSVHDPSVNMTYWKPKRIAGLFGIFGLGYIIILLLISGFNLYLLIELVIGITLGIGVVLWISKKNQRSRVYRSISVTLEEDSENVMTACLDALRLLGARVASIDKGKRTIEAKLPLSFWSSGTLINISWKTDGPSRTSVDVWVDSVLRSVLFDFGHNARVVRKIKNHLIGM